MKRQFGFGFSRVIIAAFLLAGCERAPPDASDAPGARTAHPVASYAGSQSCATCHAKEHEAWRGSQHAQAMQHATAETVLGRFDGARFAYNGITSTFFKRDGKYFVRTDGADGKLADFEIQYTFGVAPLQQYLIQFPDGRMQALSIAWDTRAAAQGGQRWFHLYPDEKIGHRDPLHWTRLNQNWNWMCAECHSTNLKRNYDFATDSYRTTWSEINVACEACHGPGSNHVAWAKQNALWKRMNADKGLAVRLDERSGVAWKIDVASGSAKRSTPNESRREVEACAQCHSRRTSFADGLDHGGRLHDTHAPALLTRGLYHADGQQQDEVYNHGSFLQSRMYARGVTCSDCHDPHSGKPRASGNALCAQCHAPAKFDMPAHTLHRVGSQGAECAACHMPVRNYMVVDARHDHSIRIPRPDLSDRLGTPNACNGCHRDRDSNWAAREIERAFGTTRKGFQTFAGALHAGRAGATDGREQLAVLAGDAAAPAIARATALNELQNYPGTTALAALERTLGDRDPMLRGVALDALLTADPQTRARLAAPLLDDPARVVRVKAARALAAVPLDGLSEAERDRRERAFVEYIASQQANAERPESHLNLGLFYSDRGDAARAAAEYHAALRVQPDFAPAWVNLADLYRALGREADVERVLQEGLKQLPRDGDLLHALGLLRVRQGNLNEALHLLGQAVDASPDNPRYAYVYGVALHDSGSPQKAIVVLKRALARFPNDRELADAARAYGLPRP